MVKPETDNPISTSIEFMNKFITFEGMDGAGKSTHIAWFAETLRQRGLDVVVTREPGGTLLGEQLREILLNRPMNIGTEALLMFAARLEQAGTARRKVGDFGPVQRCQLCIPGWRERPELGKVEPA